MGERCFHAVCAVLLCCTLLLTAGAARGLLSRAAATEATHSLPVVVVDAGHGGEDGGSSGNGLLEKEVNLEVARCFADLLKANGFAVEMVRETDSDLGDHSLTTVRERKVSDLKNRVALVNEQENCLLISIHQNYFEQSQYSGAVVLYAPQDAASAVLAQCLQDSLRAHLQPENSREIQAGNDIYLLEHVTVPAVIVECGFLSNPQEAALLAQPLYRQQLALCLYRGLCDYLEQKAESEQPVWFTLPEDSWR